MTSTRNLLSALCFTLGGSLAQAQTPAQLELFEKNARPLFVAKCQGCHNAKVKTGGLDLSSPEGIKQAAAASFFGNPGEPDKSVLLQALSYGSRASRTVLPTTSAIMPQRAGCTFTISTLPFWH